MSFFPREAREFLFQCTALLIEKLMKSRAKMHGIKVTLWKSDFNLPNTFNTETFNLVDDFNLLRRLMSEFRFTSKFLFTDCLEFQLTNTILIYCVYRISISIYQHNINLPTVQINLPVDDIVMKNLTRTFNLPIAQVGKLKFWYLVNSNVLFNR